MKACSCVSACESPVNTVQVAIYTTDNNSSADVL